MSYRKLDVEGTEYEYTIGRKNTKVKLAGKAFKIFDNEVIGSPIVSNYNCGEPGVILKYQVTPLNVRLAIQSKPLPEWTCRSHGVTTKNLTSNPFTAEIEERISYMIACPECVENCAGDI